MPHVKQGKGTFFLVFWVALQIVFKRYVQSLVRYYFLVYLKWSFKNRMPLFKDYFLIPKGVHKITHFCEGICESKNRGWKSRDDFCVS